MEGIPCAAVSLMGTNLVPGFLPLGKIVWTSSVKSVESHCSLFLGGTSWHLMTSHGVLNSANHSCKMGVQNYNLVSNPVKLEISVDISITISITNRTESTYSFFPSVGGQGVSNGPHPSPGTKVFSKPTMRKTRPPLIQRWRRVAMSCHICNYIYMVCF